MNKAPKYPIYIPSKGRADNPLTANMLDKAGIPYFFVVEENDYKAYADRFEAKQVLCLPGSDYGGVGFARNFCKWHARDLRSGYHWQLDDDIKCLMQMDKGKIVSRDTVLIMTWIEEFVDRYVNIGLAGPANSVFSRLATKPFSLNTGVFGAFLLNNETQAEFHDDVIEDIDHNLQILSAGWCTAKFNAFLFESKPSESQPGGYTELFQTPGYRDKVILETRRRWPILWDCKIIWKDKNNPRLKMGHVYRNFKQTLIPKKPQQCP